MRPWRQWADGLQTLTAQAGVNAGYKNGRVRQLNTFQHEPHFLSTQHNQANAPRSIFLRLPSSPARLWTPSPTCQPLFCPQSSPKFRWTGSTPVVEAGPTSTVSSLDAQCVRIVRVSQYTYIVRLLSRSNGLCYRSTTADVEIRPLFWTMR